MQATWPPDRDRSLTTTVLCPAPQPPWSSPRDQANAEDTANQEQPSWERQLSSSSLYFQSKTHPPLGHPGHRGHPEPPCPPVHPCRQTGGQRGHIPIPPIHALCTSHLHLCSEHNACASPRCIFTRICHNKNAALVLACLHEPSASSLLIKTRSGIAHRNKTGVLVGCGWLCVRVGNFSPEFCRN